MTYDGTDIPYDAYNVYYEIAPVEYPALPIDPPHFRKLYLIRERYFGNNPGGFSRT